MSVAELLGDQRYNCSKLGRDLESELMAALQLEERWQLARLAIAVSLNDSRPPALPPDRDGTEIRGATLLKRDGSGHALLGMLCTYGARPSDDHELARAVEAHWDRGLRLLGDLFHEIRGSGEDADVVIMDLVDRANLEHPSPDPNRGDLAELDRAIVGQAGAKRIIEPLLRDALETEPTRLPANLLFTGPASTGKTLFSKTIARILDLPFVDLNGTTLRSDDDLIRRIEGAVIERGQAPIQIGTRGAVPVIKYPPVVVFIDECHQLTRRVQDAMLTALEPSQREAKTQTQIADLSDATFLLATTDSAKLVDPFLTRTREIQLDPYSRDEVAEIIRRRHPSYPATVRNLLAVAGRLIPRQALEEAGDFDRFMRQEHGSERAGESLTITFMRLRDCDTAGLKTRDYRYLEALDATPGETAGLQYLASQLGTSEEEVEERVEPFLIQLELVERTGQGRRLTHDGTMRLKVRKDAGVT
jgi:Holliday junction resolvasome RuvABC ATP-dependent DNA helicase subunit